MKKNLCLLLVFLLLAASCGSTQDAETTNADGNTATVQQEKTTEKTDSYSAEIQDLAGYSFTFLNVEDGTWSTNSMIIDYDELTGDTLSDSIYNRNRVAETDLNFTISPVIRYGIFDLTTEIQRSVMAAEDLYDAAYVCTRNYAQTIPYICNLYDIDSIQLDEEWWSPSFVDSMTVGNSYLYGSVDYINNWTQLYVSAIFFNTQMIADYSLSSPYALVREGKWTLDTMKEMMYAVVSLNGDNDFTATKGGNCVYGHASQHEEATLCLMQGSGYGFVTKDNDNMLTLTKDYNGIVDTYDKVMRMCKEDGYNVLINMADLQGMHIFLEGRALFHQTVLTFALSNDFRDSETEYGILPMPKYDEEQSQYYTPISQYGMVVTVPVTANNIERSGYVLDYMNWISLRDVYPDLQTSMCYKGVRDTDSIEMLDIVFSVKTADIGFLWNISMAQQMTIAGNAANGVEEVISVIQSSSNTMQAALDQYTEDYFTD